MKRREQRLLVEKGISLGITLIFMAAVRPDPVSVPGVAVATLMIYECALYCAHYLWQMKRRSDRYIDATKALKMRQQMRAVELQKFREA